MNTDQRRWKQFLLSLVSFTCFFVIRAAAQQPDNAIYITFDAPDAGAGFDQGTSSEAINNAGIIAGNYAPVSGTASSSLNGFVRSSDGTIAEFEGLDSVFTLETLPTSINSSGVVVGYFYQDTQIPTAGGYPLVHCFMRDADGIVSTFDAPGAGTGSFPPNQGTYCSGINHAGVISGYYLDSNGISHGFIRSPAGNITSFDPTGSTGTYTTAINGSRTITGYYSDASGQQHGFVRAANGGMIVFDAPGAVGRGTQAWSINQNGSIAGYFWDASNRARGFVRSPSGTVTPFAGPQSGTGNSDGTFALSINAAGAVAGYFYDANSRAHAYKRAANGTMTIFEAPTAGGPPFKGTFATCINDYGEIAGYFLGLDTVIHGFLRMP